MKIVLYIIVELVFLYICVEAGEFPGFIFWCVFSAAGYYINRALLIKTAEVEIKAAEVQLKIDNAQKANDSDSKKENEQ